MDYNGPTFEFTPSIENFSKLPRFGHGSDITVLISSETDEQADYAAGLITLFIFSIIFFIFWTLMIATFKVMGPANSGYLSGHPFVVKSHNDIWPSIVRAIFLIASGLLMIFVFLLVLKGFNNVDAAASSMSNSLQEVKNMLGNAWQLSNDLDLVGQEAIDIRDDAVNALTNICPANSNIAASAGMDIIGIASQAQADLTMLADFIQVGLETMNEVLTQAGDVTERANTTIQRIDLWGWQTKLLVAGLFTLPSFLVVGVGLVMLDLDVKQYQQMLARFFMPLFMLTIAACYIICCLVLPLAVASADACSGGGNIRGGPDDTVLTIYRNIRGDDNGLIFQFVAFYTQQCNPNYYPFGFLSKYLSDLDTALDSSSTAAATLKANQLMLETQCGRSFNDVITIVTDMTNNLMLLRKQANDALDLVNCEDINRLYVNTFYMTGCTYSVSAMAWIFASSFVISICGMVMIMLRTAYYPAICIRGAPSKSHRPVTAPVEIVVEKSRRPRSPLDQRYM